MERFWLVWREGGSCPKFKHETRESAEAEAQRLSVKHPGLEFYVLRSSVVPVVGVTREKVYELKQESDKAELAYFRLRNKPAYAAAEEAEKEKARLATRIAYLQAKLSLQSRGETKHGN